ncbi:TPA: hypothetical protein U0J94_000291 [Streptococcus suis]|uniref:hypothetical protein n=1 Tax=Streptococcus suis TaxID=1307 RepID=UPI000941EF86|nr:hypothetical protein [Streptococcus suis]HEL2341523.1 hypothetical protein [Streptococcus suis]HEL9622919.1 hypothetical protein [Streptococcus suis]HEM3883799.1 hypothetical protein [Streptococcus suis]
MEETITISRTELELMIADAIARNTLPRKKKDYRDVHITHSDIVKVNKQFPNISKLLSRSFSSQITDLPSKNEIRFGLSAPDDIYTRRRFSSGIENYVHHKLSISSVQELLRGLSLAVMGASIIKDLDDDEFEHSLEIYDEFKNLFLKLYEERLVAEERILENMKEN